MSPFRARWPRCDLEILSQVSSVCSPHPSPGAASGQAQPEKGGALLAPGGPTFQVLLDKGWLPPKMNDMGKFTRASPPVPRGGVLFTDLAAGPSYTSTRTRRSTTQDTESQHRPRSSAILPGGSSRCILLNELELVPGSPSSSPGAQL